MASVLPTTIGCTGASCVGSSGATDRRSAAARPELQSRLPFSAVHRTVHRPQHLHGSSPSTLDARVPATKDQAHDHTARLTIHSLQPGVSTAHSSWVQEQAVYTRGEGRATVVIGVYVDDLIVTGDDPMQI